MAATACEIEEFHPFVWCDSDVADLGMKNAEKLAGDLKFGWRISVNSWKELIALRNGLKTAGRSFFALSDPVQHYLTHTGRTLFKQLPFEELKRLQLEVLSFSGGDSDADASLRRSHHEHRALGQCGLGGIDPRRSEECRRIRERCTQAPNECYQRARSGRNRRAQPVQIRSALPGRPRAQGEDETGLGPKWRVPPLSSIAAANRREHDRLPEVHVDGRHFVDAYLLALFYDVGMRNLSGFERVDVAKHFGLAKELDVSQLRQGTAACLAG